MHTALCDRASVVAMSPEAHEHRAGKRRWRVGTPLVFLACGALFMVSEANSEGTDLRPGRTTDLAGLVKNESEHLDRLQDRAAELTRQVDRLSQSVDDSQVRRARSEARTLRGPAGRLPVSGSGVTVTLSDAPREVRESSTPNINLLVVHQQDIQAVVNAFWSGGAEAMTIQGQRVIAITGIKCVGNTVVLHGVPYAPPYVISAIGDPERLRTALTRSPALQIYRQYVEAYALGYREEAQAVAQFPAYLGSTELRHARAAQGR
jgi:uncharacterized protein YlxW (UPF0749 family)